MNNSRSGNYGYRPPAIVGTDDVIMSFGLARGTTVRTVLYVVVGPDRGAWTKSAKR